MTSRPVLGLTMGDPAGIGPEICHRALLEPAVLKQCVPVLFGTADVLKIVGRKIFRGPQSARSHPLPRIVSVDEFQKLNRIHEPLIVDCFKFSERRSPPRRVAEPRMKRAGSETGAPGPGRGSDVLRPGEISAACGKAGYVYIEQAIAAALAGKIDGVVTAPIHKEALRLAGISHPGHTEIFTALTGAKRSCMMLYSDVLTVSMVTTHIGYHEVPGKLSVPRVRDVIELTAEAMRWLRGRAPRIGVCGLNPHAGEHGLFGQREEEQFVVPAVAAARKQKLNVAGPLVPDAAFTAAQRKKFDALVTLYHDQGHIPFKMLAFDTGVNITLGLPIIRTSVDHGTAFDIAWQGKADPQSLYAAIRVAAQLAAGRRLRK